MSVGNCLRMIQAITGGEKTPIVWRISCPCTEWDVTFFVTLAPMTTKELKSEIQKSLDTVPESVLEDILALIKQASGKSEEQVKLTRNLRDILMEDKSLLERLAK